jgi:phage-related protein
MLFANSNLTNGQPMTNPDLPFVYVGTSRSNLLAMPPRVRRDIGQALHAVQHGVTDPAAKPLRTYRGEPPMEIARRYRSVWHRAQYAIYDNAVWVLRGYPETSETVSKPEAKRTGARLARRRG